MRSAALFFLAFAVTGSATALAKPAASSAQQDALALVRAELDRGAVKLPKGATVVRVDCSRTIALPAGIGLVTVDVTPPARRAGRTTASGLGTFFRAGDVVARIPLTFELEVSSAGLVYDVTRGSALTLVVERGMVEVRTTAVAGADADVGDVLQVLLRPSGRALRARLVAKDRAVAVEDGTR
jgi:hypothetical protein